MIRNHYLAWSIADADGSEFRRMLGVQDPLVRVQRVIASRFHPSTKACWSRGHVKAGMPVGICGAEGSGRENCLVNRLL